MIADRWNTDDPANFDRRLASCVRRNPWAPLKGAVEAARDGLRGPAA
jgi:hypothetical protein